MSRLEVELMNHNSKDIRSLARNSKTNGWTTSMTGSGDLRWDHPSGAFLFSATTPSDRRSIKNLRVQMRRVERKTATGNA